MVISFNLSLRNIPDDRDPAECQGCTSSWGYPPLFCWKSPIPSGRRSNFSILLILSTCWARSWYFPPSSTHLTRLSMSYPFGTHIWQHSDAFCNLFFPHLTSVLKESSHFFPGAWPTQPKRNIARWRMNCFSDAGRRMLVGGVFMGCQWVMSLCWPALPICLVLEYESQHWPEQNHPVL